MRGVPSPAASPAQRQLLTATNGNIARAEIRKSQGLASRSDDQTRPTPTDRRTITKRSSPTMRGPQRRANARKPARPCVSRGGPGCSGGTPGGVAISFVALTLTCSRLVYSLAALETVGGDLLGDQPLEEDQQRRDDQQDGRVGDMHLRRDREDPIARAEQEEDGADRAENLQRAEERHHPQENGNKDDPIS